MHRLRTPGIPIKRVSYRESAALRNRTPTPPPPFGTNVIPACSKASRSAAKFGRVGVRSPRSKEATVLMETCELVASSSCDQPNIPRAPRH